MIEGFKKSETDLSSCLKFSIILVLDTCKAGTAINVFKDEFIDQFEFQASEKKMEIDVAICSATRAD